MKLPDDSHFARITFSQVLHRHGSVTWKSVKIILKWWLHQHEFSDLKKTNFVKSYLFSIDVLIIQKLWIPAKSCEICSKLTIKTPEQR